MGRLWYFVDRLLPWKCKPKLSKSKHMEKSFLQTKITLKGRYVARWIAYGIFSPPIEYFLNHSLDLILSLSLSLRYSKVYRIHQWLWNNPWKVHRWTCERLWIVKSCLRISAYKSARWTFVERVRYKIRCMFSYRMANCKNMNKAITFELL